MLRLSGLVAQQFPRPTGHIPYTADTHKHPVRFKINLLFYSYESQVMSEVQEETEEVNDGSNSSRVSCNSPSGVSGESSDEARVEGPVISELSVGCAHT